MHGPSLSDASNCEPHTKGEIFKILLNKHLIHSQQLGAYYGCVFLGVFTVLAWVVRKVHNPIHRARVVQRMDNAIHWINHYPADSVVCFVNTYLLDSDLSAG